MSTEPPTGAPTGTPAGAGAGPVPTDLLDNLVLTSFTVIALLSRTAAEHDMSLTQLRMLAILRDRTPAMADLAGFLGLERSSVSGLIDRAARPGRAGSQPRRRPLSPGQPDRGRPPPGRSGHRRGGRPGRPADRGAQPGRTGAPDTAPGQDAGMNTIEAGVLLVGYLDDGAPDGWPVVLSHGFPYDVHAYDEVVPWLTGQGARVIRWYQRGFGPTRFRRPGTMRSGQQAALGSDLMSLLGTLGLESPIVAGYDWGGLASCVAAALWP